MMIHLHMLVQFKGNEFVAIYFSGRFDCCFSDARVDIVDADKKLLLILQQFDNRARLVRLNILERLKRF